MEFVFPGGVHRGFFPNKHSIINLLVVDPDGLYDVVGHGTPYKIKFGDGDNDYYTPRELVRILKHRKDYKKNGIRLLSCNTGSLPDGFAQHLANKLNVTVWVPNYLVWAYPSGCHIVAPRSQYNQNILILKRGKR